MSNRQVSVFWAGAFGLFAVLIGGSLGWVARGSSAPGLEIQYFKGSTRVPNSRAIIRHAGVKLCDIEYDTLKVDSLEVFPPDIPLTMCHYFGRADGDIKTTVSRYRTVAARNSRDPDDMTDLYSSRTPPMFDQWIIMGPPRSVRRAEINWREE